MQITLAVIGNPQVAGIPPFCQK